MLKISEIRRSVIIRKLFFLFTDSLFIALAVFLSFLLRFDGKIPAGMGAELLSFIILSLLITIPIFIYRKLYKIYWQFVSITDLPNIFSAVLISSFTLGAARFFLRDNPLFSGFPRSIIFIYTILLFLFIGGLRFAKRFYWQILRVEERGVKIKEFSLPLSAAFKESVPKRVLITGGAGYIGSVLCRQLLEQGFNVRVLDKLLFGDGPIKELKSNPNFQLIQGDIFDKETVLKAISDIDAVVNLAAIVGEPACVCQKDVALKTNYLGAIYIARICKAFGIKRFIQASTCSAYGQREDDLAVKEDSKLFPVDFYAETKIYAERDLMKLVDDDFNPTILRFSTVYGVSHRMRFDLVANIFTKKAMKEKEITVFGGKQWRSLIHVSDAARSVVAALKAPLPKVANQIFNVGKDSENYTILMIAELIKEHIPEVVIKTIGDMDDARSYRVSFSKIEKALNFQVQKNLKDGIIEIRDAIKRGDFPDTENKIYYNHLI